MLVFSVSSVSPWFLQKLSEVILPMNSTEDNQDHIYDVNRCSKLSRKEKSHVLKTRGW
jgi:hypothetical protein